ncbi:DUF805 domain-containing protein [Asticcacaulis sp. YBE204]|uniref:DUF805 domain-containing protein n=1 Tax=Asticcacaulis sp. YBE204 TaxID=1282363 RepID=UPI0003C40F5B|nr:DUF805 domain-containing protein [Asticcacaulis sp. YBE204]ESQ79855.1 hypothetical protein AEYBE204_08395 [Asticcacaulis sp. YBE204]
MTTTADSPLHTGRLTRRGFIMCVVILLVLSYAPDVIAMMVETPQWLIELPVFAVLAIILLLFVSRRLRDSGKSAGLLWLALMIIVPIYLLFASPLAGFLPVPSQLSTLALIGANGIVFGGLLYLSLQPSYAPPAPHVLEPEPDTGPSVPVLNDPDIVSAPASPDVATDADTVPDAPDAPSSDASSSDSSSSSD